MRHPPSMHVLLTSLSLITSAAAHGWVQNITVGGHVYPGNRPSESGKPPFDSVIRQKYSAQPVMSNSAQAKTSNNSDLTSVALQCGPGAKQAALDVDVKAGDTVALFYYTAQGNWFHLVGPMMAYLANCGSVTCDKFDVAGAKWFKITQEGMTAPRVWVQGELTQGHPANVTIPANLNPGNYILRHEIISLQNVLPDGTGDAELFPNCVQMKVSGPGTGRPNPSDLVVFPGAYGEKNPGFTFFAYSESTDYKFPGPAVATLVSGGGKSQGSTDPESESDSTSASTIKSALSTSTPAVEKITQTSTSTHISTPPTSHTASPVPKPRVESVDDRADADSAVPSDTPEDPILNAAPSPGAQDSGAAQSRDRALTAVVVVFGLWAFYPVYAAT
ncbi:glycosyl hydrolase family 61-domain-containing protein [Mycena polygramma]|nr:glycosyl hydrolase family 61-domain-containing protein [Mycena polygramma]